jgi:hypothetical protein
MRQQPPIFIGLPAQQVQQQLQQQQQVNCMDGRYGIKLPGAEHTAACATTRHACFRGSTAAPALAQNRALHNQQSALCTGCTVYKDCSRSKTLASADKPVNANRTQHSSPLSALRSPLLATCYLARAIFRSEALHHPRGATFAAVAARARAAVSAARYGNVSAWRPCP